MQYPGVAQHLPVQFLRPQAGVRTGLAGKGKVPLAPVVQRHEGQRGEHVLRHHQTLHADAGCKKRLAQETAVHVVAHLSQKGRSAAETGCS